MENTSKKTEHVQQKSQKEPEPLDDFREQRCVRALASTLGELQNPLPSASKSGTEGLLPGETKKPSLLETFLDARLKKPGLQNCSKQQHPLSSLYLPFLLVS